MIQFKHLLAAFDALDGVYAPNTLRAYRADNRGFHAFCTTHTNGSTTPQTQTLSSPISSICLNAATTVQSVGQ